ncbi:MAG: ABC transporter substrate-binding protein [Butyrivibrio sp.]|nr:ABC transporter substrate-binding protein [Butyrivibrio sp.]
MKKKVLAIMVMTSILSGCGAKNNTAYVAPQNESTATVKVGVLRTADSLPIYVGNEMGLFKEAGADVELVEFSSASDQSKAMEGGAIDAMMTDMVVQNLITKGGTELRTVTTALGENTDEGKFLIVSSPNSNIKDIADVEGKSLAISEGTMMEFLVDSYWKELDLDISKEEKVNTPSLALRFEMLCADEVDMAILPDPMGDLALASGCNEVINDTRLQNNYSVTVIAFTKSFIDANNETVKKFMNGYNAAVDRINEHNEEDKEFIYSVANVPEPLQEKWEIPHYPKNCVPDKEEVERTVNWMVEKKLLDKAPTYEEIVDSDYIPEENS